MSASDDLVIEPAPRQAVRRTAENEDDDLKAALDNAVKEVYLNWPNEGGVSYFPLTLSSLHGTRFLPLRASRGTFPTCRAILVLTSFVSSTT